MSIEPEHKITMEDNDTQIKGSRTLSKKKYYEILEALQRRFSKEEVDDITNIIKDVLKFDPSVSLYDEKAKESIKSRRERLKAQGISTYTSSGAKAYYHRNKKSANTE